MKILGIDPGTTRAGYGYINSHGNAVTLLESGLLSVTHKDTAPRLVELAHSYRELLSRTKPELVVFEKLFFAKNVTTGMEVAQARGVLLFITAEMQIPFLELSPAEVKLHIAGSGSADKVAVATMVKRITGLKKIDGPDDVTDAIAIAIVGGSFAKLRVK